MKNPKYLVSTMVEGRRKSLRRLLFARNRLNCRRHSPEIAFLQSSRITLTLQVTLPSEVTLIYREENQLVHLEKPTNVIIALPRMRTRTCGTNHIRGQSARWAQKTKRRLMQSILLSNVHTTYGSSSDDHTIRMDPPTASYAVRKEKATKRRNETL